MELSVDVKTNGLCNINYVNGEWAVAVDVTEQDARFCEDNFYQGGYEFIAEKYGWL